ncbi:hypothetical protein N7492_001440 [Penicillium capsulatum]|uniref:MARVEL domain-containing protein n=1 Tax=Penicillium capsulatum TaxID=69766 RepID=A0A9W9IRL8_9EURO|nr:hypothetical protein N7492_001440 [Penicillium capsulatum]KAJ6129507.1 hypothetical protein N7512_002287 [Penicillium capsulatum]
MGSIVGNQASVSRPALKIASLVSAIATIISAAAGNANADREWVTYIIFGVSGLLSLILAIALFTKHRPHPGFLLALDLVCTIVMWLFGISGAIVIGYGESFFTHDELLKRGGAMAAWMIITGFLHFVAFILDCVDVYLRRTRPVVTKDPEGMMADY